ncbi:MULTISPECIES: hypothetical protein [Pseudomonas]|uniref:hypothetical protein n=1 Tax=Pseudomonas TaxID=286 RepID=UPI00027036A1|nr:MULTISPECIES: hypothetical protein [Pseudomonas]EJM26842.1 hypothetical protein PMI24_03408 [Pseudomonas sp. GM25]MCU0092155.1 hypothetical protein [Pseudomonas koreensis]
MLQPTVTDQIVSAFATDDIPGRRFRAIFDYLLEQGLKPVGKSNSGTLVFQHRGTDGNFIDVLAFRRKPEDVLSFPRSYWGSRSDRREALCKLFDYSESPSVANGVVGYTNYSSGQLAIKAITQERVMAVCIAVCGDMKRVDDALATTVARSNE